VHEGGGGGGRGGHWEVEELEEALFGVEDGGIRGEAEGDGGAGLERGVDVQV